MRSPVAIAAPARPDVSSEEAVKRAVLAARSVGHSTGPSGVHLSRLFERWGIAQQIKQRIVQAPPGVAVGTLVARGEVELGFQQLSELMHLPGITVVGALPDAIQFITIFSAGTCVGSPRASLVRAMLADMTSAQAAEVKRRHGMEPA